MDVLTPEQRHRAMKAVHNKDTSIELALRRELWARGIRYRKNCKGVFGHPDIAFIGKKVAVFCDSEFWHGFNWEQVRDRITTNRDYWIPKIERNIERDLEVTSHLESEGWIVLRFWGKEIMKDTKGCVDAICDALRNRGC